MSLERAIDDQRLMDQVYAEPRAHRAVTEHYDIVIIGSGAGGGTMAQALSASRRADPHPRAWRFRSAGGRELGSGSGLEAPALPHEGALARRARPGVPPVHALRRRRQHQVLGQRALPAAARGLPGGRARRRHLAGVADRLRHARAVSTSAPSASITCTDSTASIRPSRRADRSRTSRFRTRPKWRRSSRSCGARGSIRRRCRSGSCEPGEADGCILCNTCNSFACKLHAKSEADVCCVRPAMQRPNVTLWTNACARRLITDPRGRKVEAVEVERNGETLRVDGVAVRRVVRRRELGGAAAALGERPRIPTAWRTPRGWSGRRYMAHLATMMQGFHPFRQELDGLSENGRHQRFLLARSRYRLSAGADPVAGTHPRRHGADGRIRGSRCGPTSRGSSRGVDWLVMSEDLPQPRQSRHRGEPTAASACTIGRTT